MNITPIGFIKSPFKQKFAIPRQPGLVKAAIGEIVFAQGFSDPNSMREIEQFSHLWLIFHFHETADKGWTPLVQPPRLGGKAKVGVFASRSTFRPNGLGMSVVKNMGWEQQGGRVSLRVGSIDLLDGTPIVDIKPYIPYADSIIDANGGYAEEAPIGIHKVAFTENAHTELTEFEAQYLDLRDLIIQVLGQDPRPAWRQKSPDDKQYGMSLYDLNIKWCVDEECIKVLSVTKAYPA